jgi:hypothetical protein
MAHWSGKFLVVVGVSVLFPFCAWAQGTAVTSGQVDDLIAQNRLLAEQVQAQQKKIDALTVRVGEILKVADRHEQELQSLQNQAEKPGGAEAAPQAHSEHEIRLSAEAAFAFFDTGSAGDFPNSEFRVDDAKVFLEAPVWKNTYFFAELDLVTREAADEYFHVGELYLDFENVSALWKQDRVLNVRVGRFYIPFGEEYQVRNVMDNPLISHSVSDIWGIDEGAEIYGTLGKIQYAGAVQNGGHKALHDYDSDKAYIARVGIDPLRWLHVSGSAMRTGGLNAANDAMSEVWLANGFFRALGPAATTQTFWADLFEADAAAHWKDGHLKAALGYAKFDDDNRAANDSRQLHYYSVEGVQRLFGNLYGAVRTSQVAVPRGYPLVGQGDFGDYFFRSALTDSLRRLSMGVSYRFGPPLIWKVEYNREQGHLVTGDPRDRENLFATEIAVRF